MYALFLSRPLLNVLAVELRLGEDTLVSQKFTWYELGEFYEQATAWGFRTAADPEEKEGTFLAEAEGSSLWIQEWDPVKREWLYVRRPYVQMRFSEKSGAISYMIISSLPDDLKNMWGTPANHP